MSVGWGGALQTERATRAFPVVDVAGAWAGTPAAVALAAARLVPQTQPTSQHNLRLVFVSRHL